MKIEISKLTNQDKVERKMPKVKFNSFSNMKIQINKHQPLDEVVSVLESKGYHSNGVCFGRDDEIKTITTSKQTKSYEKSTIGNIGVLPQALTTLAELKEM